MRIACCEHLPRMPVTESKPSFICSCISLVSSSLLLTWKADSWAHTKVTLRPLKPGPSPQLSFKISLANHWLLLLAATLSAASGEHRKHGGSLHLSSYTPQLFLKLGYSLLHHDAAVLLVFISPGTASHLHWNVSFIWAGIKPVSAYCYVPICLIRELQSTLWNCCHEGIKRRG